MSRDDPAPGPTGLFPSRQRQCGPRRGYVPKNRRAANGHTFTTNKRLFAEALAEGAPTLAAAARQIGLQGTMDGTRLFRAIRADLGPQAV
jgi:hypothetical protein